MNVVLAGEGAIARKHMTALARIDDVDVVSVAGGDENNTADFAAEFDIPHWTLDLDEAFERPGVEAVILTTPTQLHASQAISALEAGLHTLVEIPMADNLADSEALVAAQQESGLVAMVCHTRRFNPSHQWIKNRIAAGQFSIQHFVVQSFFFRRENKNALGQPRTWTDHLLWHHAC
ncbi:MAG: Gfo/Idh/MocA family oxidoreductase, partial [Acidimicrobiia bacterium]|nr:Gfo/Idh/MocA family oxidoreductase [Acidimicrobiia bacterium]